MNMNTFALDKNYQQFNFEEISVDELQVISGGSGSADTVYCKYDGKEYSVGGTYFQVVGDYGYTYTCTDAGTWSSPTQSWVG